MIQRPHSARPYYCPYSGFHEGRTILGFLQFEEEASGIELQTPGEGFPCLDPSLRRVGSFRRSIYSGGPNP
jgi:hypothetical protein